MIDLSLWGLIGAIGGTVVAAVLYHLLIPHVERAMRERQQSGADQEAGDLSLSVVRRMILTGDLLAFAVLGYWLGLMFEK